MSTITKVVVFTRHNLTEEQTKELYEIATRYPKDTGVSIQPVFYDPKAKETLDTEEDTKEIVNDWVQDVLSHVLIFGVIPPILRNALYRCEYAASYLREDQSQHRYIRIVVFEAHNVNRAPEGEKPQFEFRGWYITGEYDV